MEKQTTYSSSLSSVAEDLFVELFCDVFGPEKTQYLSIQYPVVDNYGGDRRSFKYFKEETVKKYATQYKWELITPANMKDKFIEMVETMDMSFSYKPVLLKAMFEHVDENGRVRVEDIVDYFIDFYTDRKNKGLVVEKKSCIYTKEGFTRKEVERNIFQNPFKRFEDMRFMKRSREIEHVEFSRHVFRKLTREEIGWILEHCDGRWGSIMERVPK
ncbi:MAG: hypothetical protein APF84_01805 [Gracilibacter sp. BRH_c7a]|nr:MAG: hypothetical protein APF84_01805 [Gracilibacter sp. BRH_c7a]